MHFENKNYNVKMFLITDISAALSSRKCNWIKTFWHQSFYFQNVWLMVTFIFNRIVFPYKHIQNEIMVRYMALHRRCIFTVFCLIWCLIWWCNRKFARCYTDNTDNTDMHCQYLLIYLIKCSLQVMFPIPLIFFWPPLVRLLELHLLLSCITW